MAADIKKNGIINGAVEEFSTQVCIMKNDMTVHANLLDNTDFGGVSQKYTLQSGSEGGLFFTPNTQIISGKNYVISLNIRGNANINLYRINEGGNESTAWMTKSEMDETVYKRFSMTFSTTVGLTTNQIYICTLYGQSTIGDWFEIEPCSLKLEEGTKSTMWCCSESEGFESYLEENPIECNEIIEI